MLQIVCYLLDNYEPSLKDKAKLKEEEKKLSIAGKKIEMVSQARNTKDAVAPNAVGHFEETM